MPPAHFPVEILQSQLFAARGVAAKIRGGAEEVRVAEDVDFPTDRTEIGQYAVIARFYNPDALWLKFLDGLPEFAPQSGRLAIDLAILYRPPTGPQFIPEVPHRAQK